MNLTILSQKTVGFKGEPVTNAGLSCWPLEIKIGNREFVATHAIENLSTGKVTLVYSAGEIEVGIEQD